MIPLLLDGDSQRVRVVTTTTQGNVTYMNVNWEYTNSPALEPLLNKYFEVNKEAHIELIETRWF